MIKLLITIPFFILLTQTSGMGQTNVWTFENCLEYALEQNIDVQKANNTIRQNELNHHQSKYNRLPGVNASISHNISFIKQYNTVDNTYEDFHNTNNTSYGVSSSITIFNGFKLKNEIKQTDLNLRQQKYYTESIKESLELNILDAYLSILYAREEVANAKKQIATTKEQLILAEEMLNVGNASKSDFLQVKSELATEKLTLTNAESTLLMAKVNLMQLMELPVSDTFDILIPDIAQELTLNMDLSAREIFEQAMQIKPQVKQVNIALEKAILDEKIAKSDLFPKLTLSAGFSSNWSSELSKFSYTTQVNNNLTPFAGISLNIPIFQKNQVRTNVETSKIATENAKLTVVEIQNSLRKEIEQALTDAFTANAKYSASLEQYEATKESYLVAEEKFNLGIINTADFMIVKNDLILAESSLLQNKYNLLFSIKVIDFYQGTDINLKG